MVRMPHSIFQKSKGTTNWKLSSRFDNYAQGCRAGDTYASASESVAVRMVKANTEGEARGQSVVVWNSLANDAER